MNITSLANLYTSLQTSGMTAVSRVQQGLDKATARIASEQQSTQAKISAYGQVKSGFASVQSAGETLAKGSTNSTADTKAALTSLVNAYNATRSAAASTEAGAATVAANGLTRATSSDSVRSDLKSLGITRASDGSLSVDSKKLDAALKANPTAVQEAAARVGGQLKGVATTALKESGGIATQLNSLNTRASQLETRQTVLTGLSNAQQTTNNLNYSAQNGILSYLSILKL
jgi:flagellar hook-associated protein 2